jgi:DNA repair exonuclease SbcCD ATPase subunit
MILRSIRVAGWRCFLSALEVGPFGDGLNVVYGPNGVGKSSLFMALGRGLFDDHGSASEGIRQLRPWGRDLAPQVTIEFEHGGAAYRVTKRFLDGKRAELLRQEGGRFVPKAEGKAADNEVRSLLGAAGFGKKSPDAASWGLAQVLWAPQGELQLASLCQPMQQALQAALGSELASGHAHGIEERIAEQYEVAFTSTGKPRAGTRIVELEQQLTAAQQTVARHRDQLSAFDDASQRILDFRGQSAQAEKALKELECDLAKARTECDSYDRLRQAVETSRIEAEAAKAKYEQRDQRIQQLAAARKELAEGQQRLARLMDELPLLAKEVQNQEQAAGAASREVEAIRKRRKDVDEARRRADRARDLAEAQREQARLQQTIQQAEPAQAERARLLAERQKLVVPTARQLTQIQKAARARDDARLRLDAARLSVQVTAERELAVQLLADEAPPRRLSAGETAVFPGNPNVALEIAGVGTIRALGPSQSAKDLTAELEQAAERLEELTRGYGTHNIDELEQRFAVAQDLDQQLAQLRVRLEALLGEQTLEAIQQQRAVVAGRVEEILAAEPAWREAPPSPAALADEAERIKDAFQRAIDDAENRSRTARDALTQAAQHLIRHEGEVKALQNQIAAQEAQIHSLTADGLTDAERERARDNAAIEWRAAQRACEQAQQALAALGGDPHATAKTLERMLQQQRESVKETSRKLHEEVGRLESIIAQAPYSQLAAAEEQVAALNEEAARERLRLNALRLLYETYCRRKQQLVEALVAPVCKRAEQTLARIAGGRFERLQMNESFAVEGIVPRHAPESVGLDQLSGGEREQVHFAVRLALADVAFEGQRQLVVFDDVFTFTDTARLARIVGILEEAAARFQIVLLTCHPERYRGLPGARFFDLEEAAARASGAE